jgi:hypothetical protein
MGSRPTCPVHKSRRKLQPPCHTRCPHVRRRTSHSIQCAHQQLNIGLFTYQCFVQVRPLHLPWGSPTLICRECLARLAIDPNHPARKLARSRVHEIRFADHRSVLDFAIDQSVSECHVVRLVLATLNAIGLCLLRRAVARRFGRPTGLFFTLITCSQFHIPFWMGRTLPNMFALFPGAPTCQICYMP